MKNRIVWGLVAGLLLTAAPAAAQSYYQKEASLYLELFGNGGELSLNIERFVGEHVALRTGIGFTGVAYRKGYVVPFGASFFLGGGRHRIELGGGGAWIDFDNNGTDRVIFDLKEDQLVANGVFGYRFIGDYGLTYRLAFTPAYTKDGFEGMAGAAFGYSF